MKVHLISTYEEESAFQEKVNIFLKENPKLKIIDIKYSSFSMEPHVNRSALIMYEDK